MANTFELKKNPASLNTKLLALYFRNIVMFERECQKQVTYQTCYSSKLEQVSEQIQCLNSCYKAIHCYALRYNFYIALLKYLST